MKSLENRIADLRKAIERANQPEHTHVFRLNVVTTREQAVAAEERSRSKAPCPLCAAGSRRRIVVLTTREQVSMNEKGIQP